MSSQRIFRLLLATRNAGKVAEFRAALGRFDFRLESLLEWKGIPDPAETGATFAENARLKASYWHQRTGLPALADDSGLMVEALGGAPGVHSARFAPTDEERIRKLLSLLDEARGHAAGWRARFVCALCLSMPGRTLEVEGEVEGEIVTEPRGGFGFGYDPVFYYPPLGKTFAELTRLEKNQVSHRASALRRLIPRLQ